MGKAKTSYNWFGTGRFAIWDGTTFETMFVSLPNFFYDDFNKAGVAIADTASNDVKWLKKITGAAPPTVAIDTNAAGGTLSCTLTNANQKQEALAYFGDQRTFDVTKGLIFEARVKIATTPTGNAEIQVGLASDYTEGWGNISYSIGFDFDGTTVASVSCDDNSTDTEISTGVDLGNSFAILRIDCLDVSDIKFYINGARVCATSTIPFAATGANAVLQPFLYAYKASGTGVGTLTVDYVKIWTGR